MIAKPAPRSILRGSLRIAILSIAAITAAYGAQAAKRDPMKIPSAQYEPVEFADIGGWAEDDQAEAFATFLVSCRAILGGRKSFRDSRPFLGALHGICERAVAAVPLDAAGARKFFEDNFRALRIAPLGETNGFITGYYEPIVEGARLPSDEYTVPLYKRPENLLTSRLRRGKSKGKGKGKGKNGPRKVAAYYERAQIEDGAIAGRELEICYLKDPIDAFFAQIQGSTRVRLEDGTMLRLNYDAGNGHTYTAVGKFLVERRIMTREEVTMDSIRRWMEANPEEGKALRRENKSYVFFRETDLSEFDEAIGAQGISLAPGRSIAVDRRLHTYGTPFFIDAILPIASENPDTRFQRLMVAQDTGGAIVGPARADIYFGTGEEGARIAGRLKHYGRFVMLVPRDFDPVEDGKQMPVPLPRPVIAQSTAPEKTQEKAQEKKKSETAAASADQKADAVAPDNRTKTAGEAPAGKTRHADAIVPMPKAKPARQKKK